AFCAAANENTLSRLLGVYETLHLLTCGLVRGRRRLRKIVHTAMHIRMLFPQILRPAVDHHLRHLRGRRVVEIHERLPVHRLRKDGEVLSYFLNIPGAHFFYCCHSFHHKATKSTKDTSPCPLCLRG